MPSEEFTVNDGKFLIVGHATRCWQTSSRRTMLSNIPSAFLVRKVSKLGKISQQLYRWEFEDEKTPIPDDVKETFWQTFPSLAAYAIYDKHQLAIAKINVEEYCGYGWHSPPDVVSRWMGRNKYFYKLKDLDRHAREQRVEEAKNRRLEMQAQWYADDNMSAVFDVAMQPIRPTVTESSALQQLRDLDRKISKLKNEIFSAHKHENMSIEYKNMKELESKFNKLVKDNFDTLPKNGLGMIALYTPLNI